MLTFLCFCSKKQNPNSCNSSMCCCVTPCEKHPQNANKHCDNDIGGGGATLEECVPVLPLLPATVVVVVPVVVEG